MVQAESMVMRDWAKLRADGSNVDVDDTESHERRQGHRPRQLTENGLAFKFRAFLLCRLQLRFKCLLSCRGSLVTLLLC